MIDTLIDEVRFEYRDFYFSVKELMKTKEIKFRVAVKFSSLFGMQIVDVAKPNSSDIISSQNVLNYRQLVSPLFYHPNSYLENYYTNSMHQLNHFIPIFSDEKSILQASLNKDNQVTFTENESDPYAFNCLMKDITGDVQHLTITVKVANFGKDRETFEKILLDYNYSDQYKSAKRKFLNSNSNLLIKFRASSKLEELDHCKIPFNSVFKTQLLSAFLEDGEYFSDEKEKILSFLKEDKFLRRHDQIIKDQNLILDIIKNDSVIAIRNPVSRLTSRLPRY